MPTGISIILHLKISRPTLLRRGLHVQSRSYWAPANIGPYSQAISTASSQDGPWTVHIAGQIPLVPSTMQQNPSPLPSSSPQQTFALDTVLSLQHLFRIASEMQTYWFTSAVAYLPASSSSTLPSSTRAIIAGRAWSLAHTPPPSSSESDDEDDGDAPDLWEAKHNHKHHQNQTPLSASSKTRHHHHTVPNYSLLSPTTLSNPAPPFFAVEVESLPRDSAIEWHAHIGLTPSSSSISLHPLLHLATSSGEGWRLHECRNAAGRMYSVMMVIWAGAPKREGLDVVREKKEVWGCYVDVSTFGLGFAVGMGGMVPCRSIWDGEGRRLAAVLLFDN